MNIFGACIILILTAFSQLSAYKPFSGRLSMPLSPGGGMKQVAHRFSHLGQTDLISTGVRYYDPVMGHFISPDPYGHEGSWDLYSYANNDPVNFCDPDGRFGKAAFQGVTIGDFYEPTNTAQAWGKGVGQFGAGLVPVYGQAADFRDFTAAINTVGTDGFSFGSGAGVVLAGVAFVPMLGDVAKAGVKPLLGAPASAVADVAAEGTIWRGGISGIIYPRSAGLADSTTIGSLLKTRALPGMEGVTLAQRTVRFGDLQELSTLGGRQVEFALTRENGMYHLYSGGPGTIATPSGVRVIGHTHPGGTRLPSTTDINSLNNAWLRELSVNPYSPATPSRVIWGTSNTENTIFYPSIR